MTLLLDLAAVALGYLLGSIPFGLLIVKLKTGKDIRSVESGRTGGTNAMRAAGFWAGLATAICDILKAGVAVWLAQALGAREWAQLAAPIAAILGHNYSIYLPERDANGRFVRLRGGAGGAPAVGGALGLWPPSVLIIVPLGALVFFSLGYASITTMSVAFFAIVVFAWRAAIGLSPWSYVLYGVIAEALLVWALRPNIQKLLSGNERVVPLSLHGWLRSRGESPVVEKK